MKKFTDIWTEVLAVIVIGTLIITPFALLQYLGLKLMSILRLAFCAVVIYYAKKF